MEKSASDWDTDTITNLNKNVSIRFSTSLAGEAPLKRSVPVAPSASATFGPRLPARSLLRGRLRNCLIHCVVIVISDRNCVGKHSNAFLVISELSRLFLFFRKSNTFFIYFRMYFQKWKIPKHSAVLIEVTRLKFPDWSLQIEVWLLFLSCVCIDSWLPSLLDNSAEIFLKYLEILKLGRLQTRGQTPPPQLPQNHPRPPSP